MKLAEFCDTSPSYIGEIEIGRKFPSVEMIEKIADILKIEPYHLFKNRMESDSVYESESTYPPLPNSMKNEILNKISSLVNSVLEKY